MNKEFSLSRCDQLFQRSLLVRQMSQLAIRELWTPLRGQRHLIPPPCNPAPSLSFSLASHLDSTNAPTPCPSKRHHIPSYHHVKPNPVSSDPAAACPTLSPPPPPRTPPAHPHLPRHPRPPPSLADLAPFPAPNPRSVAALFPPRPRFCDPESRHPAASTPGGSHE